MERIPSMMEKYADSIRVTPERPKIKKGNNKCVCKKARVYHWEDSDCLDLFFQKDYDASKRNTATVARFTFGSIAESVKDRYTLRLSFNADELDLFAKTAPGLLRTMLQAVEKRIEFIRVHPEMRLVHNS